MKTNLALILQKMHETGVARVASNLSTHLPNDRYNKYIYTYNVSESTFSFGGEVVNLNTVESNSLFRKIFNLFKRFYIIKKLKRSHVINTTISFQLSASLINILTRRNDKIIISIRSFLLKDNSGFSKHLYKWVIKHIYKRADLIVPVSEGIKQDLIQNYNIKKEKIKVINNYYDIDTIKALSIEPIENEYKDLFKSPIFITSGRLVEQKGQWHLIRAFRRVKMEIPDAELVVLGDGNLEKYLKDLTKELEIESSVHFFGFQKNPFKYISKSDIYVFPSLYEGFPNALSEAMACGVPVISSDCDSGPREILNPNMSIEQAQVKDITNAEFGVLIPTCDGSKYKANDKLSKEEVLLANSVIQLFKDKKLTKRYKEQSEVRMQYFNKDKIIKEWEETISGKVK